VATVVLTIQPLDVFCWETKLCAKTEICKIAKKNPNTETQFLPPKLTTFFEQVKDGTHTVDRELSIDLRILEQLRIVHVGYGDSVEFMVLTVVEH
jgi:hypothetical protein